jgi:hypothetical protein
METVLAELSKLETDASITAAENYRNIVKRLADGDGPELREVQSAIEAVGKSSAQLRTDVAQHSNRNQLREQMAKAREAESELPSIRDQIAAVDAKLQTAHDIHQQEYTPLYLRLQELQQAAMKATHAESELRRSCPDKSLVDQFRANRVRLTANENHISEANRDGCDVTELRTQQQQLLERENEILLAMIEA